MTVDAIHTEFGAVVTFLEEDGSIAFQEMKLTMLGIQRFPDMSVE